MIDVGISCKSQADTCARSSHASFHRGDAIGTSSGDLTGVHLCLCIPKLCLKHEVQQKELPAKQKVLWRSVL